jgi:type III restriction enzyme
MNWEKMRMPNKMVNSIAGRLSLREPQRNSLEILARLAEIAPLKKNEDTNSILSIIKSEYPSVTDFERAFPSLCFALATGVGKTRLMGAFISYLHLAKGINHFFVLAPNLTIYNKLIADFTPNTPKYVFKGISEFSIDPPNIITGDNYESGIGVRGSELFNTGIHINIFNISKINSEVRGGKSPRIKRLSEYIGESYFDYLAALPDLVLLMDESHRYRASAGINAINELKPVLGLELTATPFTESTKGPVFFKNVIFNYPLSKAMEDGFVKEPAVVTQKNFNPAQFTPPQLEKIKLEDGIRLHESTKVELETYARQTGQVIVKPFVLVIARDTSHAEELQRLVESDEFFEGRYKGKAIQVHSNLSGDEKEEVVERLLSVEKNDEPTEIVIHVNMLKEGWDVTNLYTIIPLRAANARTLVEQSIGRGLRLPYGKRTGISAVDRLNIIAHDRFQEIVDEANRSDSPIHLKTILLDPDNDFQKTKTIIIHPNIVSKINDPAAEAVISAINNNQHLPSSEYLLRPDIQDRLAKEAEEIYEGNQKELPGIQEEIDFKKIVKTITEDVVLGTIDIPRILILPKGNGNIGFKPFKLECSTIRFQPVERDLLIQHLRTNAQETLTFAKAGKNEERLEDYIVRGLIDFDDISYDENSDLIYDLCSQLVQHLKSYLKTDDDIRNVILYHQKQLASFIHAQMLANQFEEATDFEVVVNKGFTELKSTASTTMETADSLDYRKTDFDKSKIGKLLFAGFSKCLYPEVKFGSDTERRFSIILEKESLKWFKPLKGQFQLFYRMGNEPLEYIPDFIAETAGSIYMIETKAKNEMASKEVIAKKEAAIKWCGYASAHNAKNKNKPWKYLLISHDEVKDNMTLKYYENKSC